MAAKPVHHTFLDSICTVWLQGINGAAALCQSPVRLIILRSRGGKSVLRLPSHCKLQRLTEAQQLVAPAISASHLGLSI